MMYSLAAKHVLKGLLCSVVGVCAFGVTPAQSALIRNDNFESGTTYSQTQWNFAELHYSYSGAIVANSGNTNKTFKFEWRGVDADGTNPSRHAELKTFFSWDSGSQSSSNQKLEQWIGFRIWGNADLGDPNEPVVLLQYHDQKDTSLGEGSRNPISALSLAGGKFKFGWKGDSKAKTVQSGGAWVYEQDETLDLSPSDSSSTGAPVLMGAWNNFVIHQKFNPYGGGLVEVWVNGVKSTSATKFPGGIKLGYNDMLPPYLKFGYYWYTIGSSTPGMVKIAHFDNVKVGNLTSSYTEVAP
jgi:hypothetical protein